VVGRDVGYHRAQMERAGARARDRPPACTSSGRSSANEVDPGLRRRQPCSRSRPTHFEETSLWRPLAACAVGKRPS
jgi:hypothetical protein